MSPSKRSFRIALVPESERKAEPLAVVRDAAKAIFAPAIGPRARLVVGEIVPGVAQRIRQLAFERLLSIDHLMIYILVNREFVHEAFRAGQANQLSQGSCA